MRGAMNAAAWMGLVCLLSACAGLPTRDWPPPEPPVTAVERAPLEVLRVELDVKFEFDRQVVRPESYPDIQAVAGFMRQFAQTTTLVEGHTDAIGTEAYNQRLSERRAMAVREVLINQFDIHPGRVDAVGFGELNPVADNETEEGRAVNRRVEAVVEARLE